MSITSSSMSRSLPAALCAILAAVLVTVAAAIVPASASADVRLTSVFAKPIQVTRNVDNTVNEKVRCTPEPNNLDRYRTAPFDHDSDPGTPLRDYEYGVSTLFTSWTNASRAMPSRDDLPVDGQAGTVTDLCFGFTLTPQYQLTPPSDPTKVPAAFSRPQETPALPADPDTFVEQYAPVPTGANPADYPNAGQPVDHDDLKNVAIDMPAGFAATLRDRPTCPLADFNADNFLPTTCADNTQVGTAYLRLAAIMGQADSRVATGGLPNNSFDLAGGGQLYNLAPGPNDLALMGLHTQPVAGVAPAKMLVRATLTASGSVRTEVTDVPRGVWLNSGQGDAICSEAEEVTIPGCVEGMPKPGAFHQPMYVESVGVRVWGKLADHAADPANPEQVGFLTQDFAEFGTSCQPVSATATVVTYNGVTSTMSSDPYTLTGCEDLEFKPSISIATDQRKPAVPTGAKITVGLDQASTNGKKTTVLKDAVVKLPAGLEIGAQAGSRAGGLELCTAEEFDKTSSEAADCAPGTEAGTVSIESPLIDRSLVGKVYLGAQESVGTLPDLYLEATVEGATDDTAPRIKLIGKTSADEATGQVTTSFADNPQLRFSELELTFPDGPTALFTTPRACGEFTGEANFTAWSGKTATAAPSITIDQDCDTPAFAPTYSLTPSNTEAGASAPVNVKIERADRSPWLKDIVVGLPAGMLANLKVVSECADADAAAANCAESSRIATVTTTSGAGEQPYSLTGAMYMTQYKPGHVAYTAIVVRAKVGDLDLGNVVVPGQIDLSPTNSSLSLTTTVPTRFKGIALNVRKVNVDLDRPGFPLNPTACGPHATGLAATGDGGQSATSFTSVAYSGCGSKPLAPSFNAVLSSTKMGDYPSVTVDIATRPGDSNLRSTSVDMPQFLAADIKNTQLSRACTLDGFNAGVCPASARVGSVSARVSITDDVISGDVVLVNVPGQVLPGLGMLFQGRYATRVLSVVYYVPPARNRLRAEFAAIPDLPLTSLKLVVDGGPSAPLKVSNDSCASPSFDATFGGQGGQTYKASSAVPCNSLKNAANPKIKWSKKTGVSVTLSDLGGRKLRSAKFYLPKGLTWNVKNAKKKNAITGKVTGAKKATAKRSKTTLTVSTKEATGTGLSIKLKANTIKRAKSVKKGKKLKLKLRLGFTDGTAQTKTVTVKAP